MKVKQIEGASIGETSFEILVSTDQKMDRTQVKLEAKNKYGIKGYSPDISVKVNEAINNTIG